MQPNSAQDYKQLLTEVIKKQIVILGPDITLAKARNVAGLQVADDGTVLSVAGSPQQVTQALIDQFVQLSGLIVKKTMEPLLAISQSAAEQPAAPAPAVPPSSPAPLVENQPLPASPAPQAVQTENPLPITAQTPQPVQAPVVAASPVPQATAAPINPTPAVQAPAPSGPPAEQTSSSLQPASPQAVPVQPATATEIKPADNPLAA